MTITFHYIHFRFLRAELNHVESQAVVLIGKGIGGYLATMMMAMVANEEEEIFKCGIVISPTTDWFRYGTYFTLQQ
jgi:tRNA(His) 5'-end guanylyltransferase